MRGTGRYLARALYRRYEWPEAEALLREVPPACGPPLPLPSYAVSRRVSRGKALRGETSSIVKMFLMYLFRQRCYRLREFVMFADQCFLRFAPPLALMPRGGVQQPRDLGRGLLGRGPPHREAGARGARGAPPRLGRGCRAEPPGLRRPHAFPSPECPECNEIRQTH